MQYQFLSQGSKLEEIWQWARRLITDLNTRDGVLQQAIVPPGMALIRRGSLPAPAGYVLEDGASYPIDRYPALFAAIGYTYGGAGANFNVPNNGSSSIIKV